MAGKEATTGEAAESNVLKDRWGQERPWDPERYPEDSAAREGHITKPSGQGGATPKSRPDHQDMFPANPLPDDEATREKIELNEKMERGEVSPITGKTVEEMKGKSNKTTTTAAPKVSKPGDEK